MGIKFSYIVLNIITNVYLCAQIMKQTLFIHRRYLATLLLLLAFVQLLQAQITGQVIDASDGGPVSMASVVYRGNKVATLAGADGRFHIERHNGWRLTVSAVGYVPQVINISNATPTQLTIRLKPDTKALKEVTIQSKRKSKYSRKKRILSRQTIGSSFS